MSSSVQRYQTVNDVKNAVLSLGFKWKQISGYPSAKQSQKADTVYFVSRQDVRYMNYPYHFGPDALGIISFGTKLNFFSIFLHIL